METGAQQPQTGLGGIVPTAAPQPQAQPGQVPSIPDAQGGVSDKTKQMLATLIQAAQRKQMANTAQPRAMEGMQDPNAAREIGMGTRNPKDWGFQRFAAGVATNIRNAVAKEKNTQLLKAEGDWTTLQSYMNEKYAAQAAGDQKGVQAADAKLDSLLGDPKKLKNMAKALNQDWLNPEKTTVHGEALKRVAAKTKQQDAQQQQQAAQKQTAAQKLKSMMMGLVGKNKELQLTVDEQKKLSQEIQAKAPTTSGVDKETALALRDEMKADQKSAEDEKNFERKVALDAEKDRERQEELERKQEFEKEQTEVRQKFTLQRDKMQNDFHQTMQGLHDDAAEARQNSRDLTMMKMLGMKLDAQQEKLFKPDPQKLNSQVTATVGTLKSQLAQASRNLQSTKSAASTHYILGPGKEDIKAAQEPVDNLQKAIEYLEKNRDAIIKGKADLGEVVDKAYSIMDSGADDSAPPPPIPGAVVTKGP